MNKLMHAVAFEAAKQRAEEMGLVIRPIESARHMQPGYYMDLNYNLVVLKNIEYITHDDGIELKVDADIIHTGEEIIDMANEMAIIFWEFLDHL